MSKSKNKGTGREVIVQIKKAMVDQDYTVVGLAKAIGEAPSTLYNHFNNPRRLTIGEILLIIKALKMEGIEVK